MQRHQATLGTLLRRLIDALDGAVENAYREAGLDFRPRYTPVIRLLLDAGPMPIRDIARQAGVSHSALSQTVSQLQREGWVELRPGHDRRERVVHPSDKTHKLEPALRKRWAITAAAAASLDAELPCALEPLLRQALEALEARPFTQRLADAALDTTGDASRGS
ncbi:MarR family transcriptional regulator [Altererythrobacter sp. C41]|nr:MarR family transcriptional regulator [Altererythrobacter sp. C41]